MARLRKLLLSIEFNCVNDCDNSINEEVLKAVWLARRKDGSTLPLIRVKLLDQEEYYKNQPDLRCSLIHDGDHLNTREAVDYRMTRGQA